MHYKRVGFFLLLSLISFLIQTTFGAVTWVKFPGNPVIDVGGLGAFDEFMAYAPDVVFDGSTYHLWYVGRDMTPSPNHVLEIGYAYSTDGESWMKYVNNPVLARGPAGSWDDFRVMYASVILDSSGIIITNCKFKMWYTASSDWSYLTNRIGYAESADGITWTRYALNPVLIPDQPWEGNFLHDPEVVKVGSTYYMWYVAGSYPPVEIGLATSTDGITWAKYAGNPVLSPQPGSWDDLYVYSPTVVYQGGLFYMWYSGMDGPSDNECYTGEARSSDGIAWTKDPANPTLIDLPGTWEDSTLTTRYPGIRNLDYCDAVFAQGAWRIYYSGYGFVGTKEGWRIGLAKAAAPVGGFWVPINKSELLAPWLTLASLITVATVSLVYVKHRKKKQEK